MESATSLSISQVNAYLACPLKYRFQYLDRIPKPWQAAALSFGISVHRAVEYFHRERMAGRSPNVDDAAQVFEEQWEGQNIDPLVYSERESKEGLATKGLDMLRLYLESVASRPPPQAVEQPFSVELFDPETGELFELNLRGYIDLIEEDGTVVDLKTAGRSLESGGIERHLQLSTYALAICLQTGHIPKLRLDVLLKTTRPRLEQLPTSRTREELSWTAHLIRQVSEAIFHGQFFPNPSWRCGECEYFAHCQVWRGNDRAAFQTTLFPIEQLANR